MPEAKPRKTRTNGKKPAPPPKEVVFPEFKVMECRGEEAMTLDDCVALLGWTECASKTEKGVVPELSALTGKFIKMTKNTRNRYLTVSWLLTLRQEHLRRRWRFNGETIVISKYGNVLSGQHRLISLILAVLEWRGANKGHWEEFWQTEPTMETLVVYGVEEDDDTFKTLNCGKPGSLAETLYRSEYFEGEEPGSRRTLAQITDTAVKMLWDRTGAKKDAWAPRRTQGEALDFIERHGGKKGHLIRAVKHIKEENADGAISNNKVSAGNATALLWLMGCSSTADSDAYSLAEPPSDKKLDWDNWEKACEFWVCLAKRAPELRSVFDTMGRLKNSDGTPEEYQAVVIKAWHHFVQGHQITDEDLKLKYKRNEWGINVLVDFPTCGGIDFGKGGEAPKAEAGGAAEGEEEDFAEDEITEDSPEEADPTPEQVEELAKQARAKRVMETAARLKAAREAKKAKEKAEKEAAAATNGAAEEETAPPESIEPSPESLASAT